MKTWWNELRWDTVKGEKGLDINDTSWDQTRSETRYQDKIRNRDEMRSIETIEKVDTN